MNMITVPFADVLIKERWADQIRSPGHLSLDASEALVGQQGREMPVDALVKTLSDTVGTKLYIKLISIQKSRKSPWWVTRASDDLMAFLMLVAVVGWFVGLLDNPIVIPLTPIITIIVGLFIQYVLYWVILMSDREDMASGASRWFATSVVAISIALLGVGIYLRLPFVGYTQAISAQVAGIMIVGIILTALVAYGKRYNEIYIVIPNAHDELLDEMKAVVGYLTRVLGRDDNYSEMIKQFHQEVYDRIHRVDADYARMYSASFLS